MNNASWWAQKLGTPQAVSPLPPTQPTIPQSFNQGNTEQPAFSKPPVSAPQVSSCPGCGSGNYTKVGSVVTARGQMDSYQCYDCGYPVQQSGSGVGGVASSSSGPARPARQVEGGGWNPQTIVGRIE